MIVGHSPPKARVLCLGLCAVLFSSCGKEASDPEAEVRAWIAAAEEDAESRDRRGLVDRISTNYADARGNDRSDLDNMIRYYMLRQQSIAVLTKIDRIDMLGESAAGVALTVGMAGTDGRMLGLNADAYRFELELEKEADQWVLIGARWGEVGGKLR